MRLEGKKSVIQKYMKRLMAVSLSFAMLGGCFGIQSLKPTIAKAATTITNVKENFDDAKDTSSLKGSAFGKPTLTIVENGKHGKALMVSNRTENYYGYSYNLDAFAGSTISIKAKISIVEEKKPDKKQNKLPGQWYKHDWKNNKTKFAATLKLGDNEYKQLATVTTKGKKAATLKCAKFDVPTGKNNYTIYFEGPKDVSYIIDDIEIKVVGAQLPKPTTNLKEMNATFELSGATPESEGFFKRGDGSLSIQNTVAYAGKYALRITGRTAAWNGISFDVSRFAGKTIDISAFIKTTAPEAKLSADIDKVWPNLAVVNTSDGNWKQIKATYTVPTDQKVINLYFETSTKTDDIYIDNVNVKLKVEDLTENCETTTVSNVFTPRWEGAGTLSVVSDGAAGNHSVVLKNRTESYMGIAFDVSSYLGMQVEVSMDVKTNDSQIKITGDIENVWPNYFITTSVPGQYKSIRVIIALPSDVQKLKLYVETDGKSDLYIDNLKIKKVQ